MPAHPTLASSTLHSHAALALGPARWQCAHVWYCPPCSTIHHPVTKYKTFSVALRTIKPSTTLPSFHFLLQPFRGLAVTVCFLLQLFWFLPLLSAQHPFIYSSETRRLTPAAACSAVVPLESEGGGQFLTRGGSDRHDSLSSITLSHMTCDESNSSFCC